MGAGALVMPRPARLLVGACIAAGALSILGSIFFLPYGLGGSSWVGVVAGGGLLAVATLLLQVRSPALHWRGKTMSVHLDEGLLLVGFVVLPPGVVVLCASAGCVAAQLFLRKHPVKMAFNASVQAAATGLAALAYVGLLATHVPAFGASLAVPLVVTGASFTLVAMLMVVLDGQPPRRAFTSALLASIVLASLTGITFGILALGLYAAHPLAVALLIPLGWLLHRAVTSEYRHQNELSTRRALQRAHERLVAGPDEDGVVHAGLDACHEALDLLACEVELARPGESPRRWGRVSRQPAGPTRVVRAPLHDGTGAPVGELRATVQWNGDARLAEDQQIVGLVGASLSMALTTAAALRSLHDARQGLSDVLDAAQEPIAAWDHDGRLVHQNEAARALFGAAPLAEASAVFEDASAGAFRQAMDAPPQERAEIEAWTREGRAFEMRKAPIRLPGDRVGTLLVGRDVTERRRLEREAQAHQDALARNERLAALGILATGVAHEVNSPLMAIQGHLEMTMMDLDDLAAGRDDPIVAQCREQLQKAVASAERIGRITRGLGALGGPERKTPAAGCDLSDAARRMEDEGEISIPDGVIVERRYCADPLPVRAAPADLKQIALQLTRNAVESVAAHGSGRVLVETAHRDGWTELRVEDDGPGVPPHDAPKLFTPFHTTKLEGTGLGLPIALALARSAGGDITHEPRPGGGARFVARFPPHPEASRARSLLNPPG